MVFCGFIGLMQAGFLPGFALLSVLRWKKNGRLRFPEIFLFGFGISLLFNYLATLVLTFAGVNSAVPQEAFVLLEAVLLVRAFLGNRERFLEEVFFPLGFAAAALLFSLALYLFCLKGSAIFRGADEIFSWNAWALQWAHNEVPAHTGHYPQLLPAVLSVVYLLNGNAEIDFFPKALMPMFSLAIGMVFAAFYGQRKEKHYLVSIPLFFLLLYFLGWGGRLAFMCMADIPSAFSLFLCYYAFRKWESSRGEPVFLVLCAAFTGMALVTKQGGFIILPFFLTAMAVEWEKGGGRGRAKDWLAFWMLALSIALPWYLYVQHQISLGANQYDHSETWVIHHGATFYQTTDSLAPKLAAAFRLLSNAYHGKAVLMVLAFLYVLSLRDAEHRAVLLWTVFFYTLVWALFLSYDVRNLNPSAPFCALAAGLGLEILARKSAGTPSAAPAGPAGNLLTRIRASARAPLLVLGPVLFAAALGALALAFPREKLMARLETVRMEKIGDSPSLNSALYAYFGRQGGRDDRKIASYYVFLNALPGLAGRYEYSDLKEDRAVEKIMRNPAIGYILLVFNLHWHTFISAPNMAKIGELTKAGTLRPVFRVEDGWLLEIQRGKR